MLAALDIAEKIKKLWCSLVRFGVYFDQIVFEKVPKN